MKKIIFLLLILVFMSIGRVSADQFESARIIMEEGKVGDTVKLYLVSPADENFGDVYMDLRFDNEALEYIDSEFLNPNGLNAEMSVINNSIKILVSGLQNKRICLVTFFKLKTDIAPSFYLAEEYFDKNGKLIVKRSGYIYCEMTEKSAAIPIDIEPSYSEIEIFIRDKYVLLTGEYYMSGTIWVSAYDALGNLIDITSYKPSNRITTKPYSKASFVKIMWWDKRTFAPVCDAETLYFK